MPAWATVTSAVVMGVAGSGKSTVARRVAERFGWEYAEGDDFHPPANVDKMRAGHPLDDTDRWPWLAALGAWVGRHVNDAGFWLVKEYFGLSVGQTVASWSVMETIISVVGLAAVLLVDLVV